MHFSTIHALDRPSHLLIIPLTSKDTQEAIEKISNDFGLPAQDLIKDFKAAPEEIFTAYTPQSELFGKIVLLGLGDKLKSYQIAHSFRAFAHKMAGKLPPDLVVDLLKFTNLQAERLRLLEAAVTGLQLGKYQIGMLKSERQKPDAEIAVEIALPDLGEKAMTDSLNKAKILAEAQMMAMDLVNLPGNHANAQFIADKATKSAVKYGINIEVKHKAQLQEEGFHALLAVNQGSYREPKLITMEYKPDDATTRVVLVGKGVTFDTGGISLKGAENMHYMKSDMGGAAAVIATLESAARLKLPIHLVGIVPATDNMPGQNAIVPGDVISSYAGKTIEVENTDAEGRLILADGMAYALKQYQPDIMIDLATLTGACVIALGNQAAGLFSANDELRTNLMEAGETSGDRVWPLPIWDEYFEQLHSDVADLKNVGGRMAGAITAAKFLEFFTDKHPAWAHLDIAPVAFGQNAFAKQYAASGFGVRLLIEFLEQLSNK